jgi:uncharacterized protein (DUF2252 family)
MRRAGMALVWLWAVASCADEPADARQARVLGSIAAFDESMIRARPALAAGKYAKMAGNPFDYHRGAVPVFRTDMRSGGTTVSGSRFELSVPLVPSLGDPHPENFGVLLGGDGLRTLEPNDFDAADRAPYLWDVRRMAVSMAMVTYAANADDPTAQQLLLGAAGEVVARAVTAYAETIGALARGAEAPAVLVAQQTPILADLLRRSARDEASRQELTELTEFRDGARVFRRGSVDPEDPQSVLANLPPYALRALPPAVAAYRRTLLSAPPSEDLQILDAVRQFGSGVASWPRIRVLLLVRGPTAEPGDDIVLELKELADSGIGGLAPPFVYADSVQERTLSLARASWSRPVAAPLWGTTSLLGLPCQVRLKSEGQKSVRIERMVGDRGTKEAVGDLGTQIGIIVARVHGGADRDAARLIAQRIAQDPTGFVDEQVRVALDYAKLTIADHARFRAGLARVGPRLGLPFDPTDTPSPDAQMLIGVPPAAPPAVTP